MTRDHNDTSSARREVLTRPYRLAILWTTVIWLVVVAAFLCRSFLGTAQLAEVSSGEALTVAIASLLIAYTAVLPGLFDNWVRETGKADEAITTGTRQSDRQLRQTGLLVAGVMIRLLGTVALFLTCRYQMATPTEAVAAMTIGWYVLLTFVEVLVMARELPDAIGGAVESGSSRSPASGQGFARD